MSAFVVVFFFTSDILSHIHFHSVMFKYFSVTTERKVETRRQKQLKGQKNEQTKRQKVFMDLLTGNISSLRFDHESHHHAAI